MFRDHLLACGVLAIVLGWAGMSAGDEAAPSPRSIGGLPFVALDASGPIIYRSQPGKFMSGFTLADTDGDGHDDLLTNRSTGVVLNRHDGRTAYVVDQWNVPPGYVGDLPYLELAPYDADGDGRTEVAVTAMAPAGDHGRLWIIDVQAQRVLGDMVLPSFAERRDDGVWDGCYFPIGELPLPGRPRPALLLLCLVQHDVHGRGLLAVDPIEGTVLWRRVLDAKIERNVTIADLDGDGRVEVIAGASGVNNLKGQRLYGASDDSSRVFVFADDGALRWQAALGGPGSVARPVVADLAGDGQQLLVVSTSGPSSPRYRVTVWSPDGRMLTDLAGDREVPGDVLVAAGGAGEDALIVGVHRFESLTTYRWEEQALVPVRQRDIRGQAFFLVEAINEVPGPEIATINDGQVNLYDRSLRRLAAVSTPTGAYCNAIISWKTAPGHNLTLLADGTSTPLTFARAPRPMHPAWFLGGSAATLSLVGLGWRRWQGLRQRRGDQVETDPVILRELRLQLLARLQKSGHEKIGALKSLRRLVWRLEAESVREADGASAVALDPGNQRVAEAVGVVQDEAVPRLRELLVLGRRTGVPEHLLWMARDLLDELVAALGSVPGVRGSYADRHRQLGGLAEELDAVLQRLRHHVEQHFRSDLAGTIERVLVAQGDALMAAAVSVTITPHEAAPAPQVAIDVQDLEFVLDNLVGNAVRAMDGSSRRELHLEWSVAGERLLMTVADTGCGIAPDDWDAIFDEGWSTRPGGGYGLARSRRELATYGGSLRVLKSAPGQGTTFVMMLPVAGDEGQSIYREL